MYFSPAQNDLQFTLIIVVVCGALIKSGFCQKKKKKRLESIISLYINNTYVKYREGKVNHLIRITYYIYAG